MKTKRYPDVLDPEGTKHTVVHALKFAKENKLDPSSLSKLLNKKQNSHKGWKLA